MLDEDTLLVAMEYLGVVEVYHIGAVATHYASTLQMLCHSAQGVANHTLFGGVAIDVVDADIVVGRLDQHQVLATDRESHLALLVENLNVGTLQHRLVTIYLLAQTTQLATVLLPHKIGVAHSVRDEEYERCVDKRAIEELLYRPVGVGEVSRKGVDRCHHTYLAQHPHYVADVGYRTSVGVGSKYHSADGCYNHTAQHGHQRNKSHREC